MEKVKILHRALQWEMCRSLIVVFDWYTSTGPEFAQRLLQIHQQGGYKALKLQLPPFADIVDHIVQYVQESQDAAREGKQTSKRKAKSAKRTVAAGRPPRKPPTMPEMPRAKIGPVRQQLSQVPYDLYGLRDGAKKTQMIHLPNLVPYHVKPGLDTLYTSGGYVL